MSQPHQQSDVRNRLLATMAKDDFVRLAPNLELVSMALRAMVIQPHRPIAYVHFVEHGIVSLIADTAEGRIEIGLVGREGFVGVSVLLDCDTTPHAAMVQSDVVAFRLPVQALRNALDMSPTLRSLLGYYVQCLIVQIGQTVHANADLTIEGRLARWILMTHDRLQNDELLLTHEFLSIMLGVRRPGVTTALQALEGSGMIRAGRGRITVRDREKLLDMAGDTYGLAETEYERFIPSA